MADLSENAHNDLMNRDLIFNFYKPAIFHDRVLLVEGKKFYVQSGYLSVCSLYFRTLFNSHFKENKEDIEIKDVSSGDFNIFLKFIYPGSSNIEDYEIEPLINLSYRFLAPGARTLCEERINEKFARLDKGMLLKLAFKHGMEKLKIKTLDYIKKNIGTLNPIQLLKLAFELKLEDLKKKLRCLIYSAEPLQFHYFCEQCPDRIQKKLCIHIEAKSKPLTRNSFMNENIEEILNLPDHIKNFVLRSSISYI